MQDISAASSINHGEAACFVFISCLNREQKVIYHKFYIRREGGRI